MNKMLVFYIFDKVNNLKFAEVSVYDEKVKITVAVHFYMRFSYPFNAFYELPCKKPMDAEILDLFVGCTCGEKRVEFIIKKIEVKEDE